MIKHEYITNGQFCASLNYFIKSSPFKRDIDNVYINSSVISIDEIYSIYKKCVTIFNERYFKIFNIEAATISVKIPVTFDIDTVELIERIIIKLSIRGGDYL